MLDLICIDAENGLREVDDGTVDLTVTSPPYDQMRDHGGHQWNYGIFKGIADQLWRVTCPGGVICWQHQDQIIDGGQSCTGFRHVLYFQHLGFRLHETLAIHKSGLHLWCSTRHNGASEFVFVLSKGAPRVFRPIMDRPNKSVGKVGRISARLPDGTKRVDAVAMTRPFGKRDWVWQVHGHIGDQYLAQDHPAIMQESLAQDLIRTYSAPCDLVLDPFAGTGTTLKMALLNNRAYLGFEIHQPYVDLAQERLRKAKKLYLQ